MESYHDNELSAHLGLKRTFKKLCERYFWPDMSEFVKLWIKSYVPCQKRKTPKTKPFGSMQPIVTSKAFEILAIDHLGPLPKSFGNEYIIVLTDNFSKLAVAKPVSSTSSKLVAKFIFEDIILTYAAIPQKLLSDCSQSFLGKVVSHLNILMGIKQVKTSGYKPSTNSITERYNGTLAQSLAMYVNDSQSNWSQFVKPVVFAYNSTVQESTGYSPIEILFGHKAQFPADIDIQLNKIKGNPSEYALGLANYLESVKKNVFERLNKQHIRDKAIYDKTRTDLQFKVNDKVLFYNPAIAPGQSK